MSNNNMDLFKESLSSKLLDIFTEILEEEESNLFCEEEEDFDEDFESLDFELDDEEELNKEFDAADDDVSETRSIEEENSFLCALVLENIICDYHEMEQHDGSSELEKLIASLKAEGFDPDFVDDYFKEYLTPKN